jgi:hypothetical protein
MDDLEEALRNIDVFCKVFVKKMLEDDESQTGTVESMENLLRGKYTIEEHLDSDPVAKRMIPLPQLEEPLVDVFEDDGYVRVLMHCRCEDQKVNIHTGADGLEICRKECYKDDKGEEICTDKCQKLNLQASRLQLENMISKCNNNAVLEIDIPKTK